MTPPRRRGRRVPPKHGSRTAPEPFAESASPGSGVPDQSVGPGSRSQNRAAKRAASGVRPGQVRGRVSSKRGYSPAVLGLAIATVLGIAAIFIVANPFGSPTASASPSAGSTGSPYGDGTCPTSQPAALGATEVKYVTVETEKGAMVLKIDGALSPIAGGNFVALAECGYYDGVVFHRTPTLESGAPFVIQGGDPAGTGSGDGPGYTIQDEPVTANYVRGTLAMARTNQPNSQGSQFFIVLSQEAGDILKSANTYAIFGEVIQGMDVADAIFSASGGQELPTDPIAMTTVTVSDVAPPEPTAAPTVAPTAGPTLGPTVAPTAAPTQ